MLGRLVAPVLLQGTGIGRWRLWWTRDPLLHALLLLLLLLIGRLVVVVRGRTNRRILLGGLLSLGLLLLLLRHRVAARVTQNWVLVSLSLA